MTLDDQQEPRPTYVSPTEGKEPWSAAAFDVLMETAQNYEATVTYSELAEVVQERSGLFTRTDSAHWIGSVLSTVSRRCADENLPPLSSVAVVRPSIGDLFAAAVASPDSALEKREAVAARARLRVYREFASDIPDDVVRALAIAEREEAVQAASKPAASKPAASRPAASRPAARTSRAASQRKAAAASSSRTRASGSSRAKAAPPTRAETRARPAPSRVEAAKPTRRVEEAPAICPTCYTALPATGICDTCD
ncbi:MAG TPA: hypothetical protein VFC82_02505 [Actinomycetaceae bacterium]|nr:hypothetical protein [Actinomycetaceae bacterium]